MFVSATDPLWGFRHYLLQFFMTSGSAVQELSVVSDSQPRLLKVKHFTFFKLLIFVSGLY
jgi:hypothetical protein